MQNNVADVRNVFNIVEVSYRYGIHVLLQPSMLVGLVTEWLRRWTQDQGVCGLIPTALVMCNCLEQALNPQRLCLHSNNGYRGNENWNCVKLQCILPRDIRLIE